MLAVENITKRFPGVTALDNVCLELQAGKVNAIIGENGAGKSTLMKILSGVYDDYEGQIIFKGEPISFTGPRHARDAGIAIIHQELNLIPYLSIYENIYLGRELVTSWGMLDKKAMRLKTKQILDRLKLQVSPDTLVYKLRVGQQQVVEIAKALLVDADVIIMDEPTSAISENEVELLFAIIEQLRQENKAIVYISHKLDELFKIADRYIVLRDGKSIGSGEMKGMTHDGIIQKMVGREVNIVRKKTSVANSEKVLCLSKVCLQHPLRKNENFLKDINLSVHKGEIVGIFGLMGAGRTELLETIFGLHPKLSTGSTVVDGREVVFTSPAQAIRSGIALVPEDRKKDGVILGLDISNNISLTSMQSIEEGGFLSERKEAELAGRYIKDLQIKTSSRRQKLRNLSGGNQQKVVLAKWLATKPKLLMLDEPTRGIDINAKNEIYRIIMQLADEGLGIIMVSSEITEILAVSDRIVVMSEGCITAEMTVAEASEDKVLKAAIPKTI